MIFLKKAKSFQTGEQIAKDKIENGEAFKKFLEIVELQGGNINYINNPESIQNQNLSRKFAQ